MELLHLVHEHWLEVSTAISVLRSTIAAGRGIRALTRRYRGRRGSPSE